MSAGGEPGGAGAISRERKRETSGLMEIGLGGRVRERPVRQARRHFLDDCAQGQSKGRAVAQRWELRESDAGFEAQTSELAMHADAGRVVRLDGGHHPRGIVGMNPAAPFRFRVCDLALRKAAHFLNDGLKGIDGVNNVYESPDCKHVYYAYTLTVDPKAYDRDEFLRTMYRKYGIQGIQHYQPTYHFTGLKKLGITGNCPNAEEFFYKRETNLPMHPRLTQQELNDMVEGIRNTARDLKR